MRLTLVPQVGLPGQPETVIEVDGDVLVLDGQAHDFSVLGEDAALDLAQPFLAPVRRVGGSVEATILVRLDPATAAADQPDSPWTVEAAGGPVAIPAVRRLGGDDGG